MHGHRFIKWRKRLAPLPFTALLILTIEAVAQQTPSEGRFASANGILVDVPTASGQDFLAKAKTERRVETAPTVAPLKTRLWDGR